MASEDSDELASGLLSIHRLSDLGDLDQTLWGQMSTTDDQLDASRELLEVTLLRGAQRVPTKERNDRFRQVRPSLDEIVAQMLFVVVVPPIYEDAADLEEVTKLLKAAETPYTLRYGEPMRDLVASLVALAASSVRLPNEAN
jgi:hypothetical protein